MRLSATCLVTTVAVGIACSPVVTTADVGVVDEDAAIRFFLPFENRYLDFNEAFFSVPGPIVVLDPVVFGNPDDYPDNSTIQQVGPDEMRIRLRGRVFDLLADMVADRLADIEEVRVYSHLFGELAIVRLQSIDSGAGHPFGASFENSAAAEAVRPYPFTGRFELGEMTLPINSGYNGISVAATNINETTGTATLNVRATVNREDRRYDLTADVSGNTDAGLYNPVLVYLSDPLVTAENVGHRHALINGHKVGLRFVGGQLQLDRPVIGINHSPPVTIPNVVNVVGNPNGFLIRYAGHETEFHWSYTGGR